MLVSQLLVTRISWAARAQCQSDILYWPRRRSASGSRFSPWHFRSFWASLLLGRIVSRRLVCCLRLSTAPGVWAHFDSVCGLRLTAVFLLWGYSNVPSCSLLSKGVVPLGNPTRNDVVQAKQEILSQSILGRLRIHFSFYQ